MFVLLAGAIAVAMAVTGLVLHPAGSSVYGAAPGSQWHLFDATDVTLRLVLPVLPVLAGMFLGAPLVAREYEHGTARFAWAQGAGRAAWLIAIVVPITALLAVVAAGLGLEYRWWANPLLAPGWPWRADLFGLNPLPFTGWMLAGFAFGVFAGAAIRRTVAAMAATFACYAVLLFEVTTSLRSHYIAPVRMAARRPTFSAGGGFGYGLSWRRGPGPQILSRALGWPDGRLLSQAQLHHPPAWFRSHHIQIWLTYQPGSRLAQFQLIEFGWLAVLSVLLIAATVAVIRRRPA
jgi:hypothetical protein